MYYGLRPFCAFLIYFDLSKKKNISLASHFSKRPRLNINKFRTLDLLTKWYLNSSGGPPHKKSHWSFSIWFATPTRGGKREDEWPQGVFLQTELSFWGALTWSICMLSESFFFICWSAYLNYIMLSWLSQDYLGSCLRRLLLSWKFNALGIRFFLTVEEENFIYLAVVIAWEKKLQVTRGLGLCLILSSSSLYLLFVFSRLNSWSIWCANCAVLPNKGESVYELWRVLRCSCWVSWSYSVLFACLTLGSLR